MPELDGVRGIACIFIVLLHCLVGISSPAPGGALEFLKNHSMPFLIGGVDLFFVLSGFLIGGILIDNKGASNYFRAFWTRRIARIFPVNYALIASYVLVLSIQGVWHFPQLDIRALEAPVYSPLWYATFTQSIPFAMTGFGPRWTAVTWSLAIEEQFYLLFPFAVYFLRRRHIVALAIGAIVVSPILFAIVQRMTGRSDAAYVLLPCRMSALFLGVLVACLIRDERAFAIAKRYRLLLDVVILVMIYSADHMWIVVESFALERQGHEFASILFRIPLSFLQLSTMFALLLLRIHLYQGGLFRALLRWRILGAFGLISYALYMYHQAINSTLHGFIFNHAPQTTNLAEVALALLVMALAVSLAVLSYFYLERPIRELGRRVRFERASSPSALPPQVAGPAAIAKTSTP